MNKQFTKALALGLAAMMVLGGCGGASTETKAPEEASAEKPQQQQEQSEPEAKRELTEVVIPKIASSELETFNFLHSQRSEDAVVLLNLWDGLLTSNSRGEIIAAVADEWGTKDGGLTWKFHLRDGVKWVDVNANEKADCTAEDFATGLEWVLNFHKNESVNTSMPIEMIKGAEEYYEYTKTLSEEEARALTAGEGSKFREMVGMEIVDKNNIIYHCVSEKPYFDTLATSNCLYPLAQGLVSIIIIAANAGGAWTPIGDVTTIMLWINDNITSGNIMKGLFLPSVISLAIPVWLVSYSLKSNSITTPSPTSGVSSLYLGKQEQTSILIIGILCLLAVPIFKSLTDLPPFAGILFTLGFLWFYTDCLYNRKKTDSTGLKYRIPDVLTKVDFSTILFFFGILMAVAALEAIGLLHQLSDLLNSGIHNVYIITGIIGFLSSVIDNVPLVAAAMGMYPLTAPATAGGISETAYLLNFVSDGNFWKLLAYCAGTGGSILIIGSAAGVVVMGLEKISFTWYMRHISWIAITGFLAGIGIYYLQNLIF